MVHSNRRLENNSEKMQRLLKITTFEPLNVFSMSEYHIAIGDDSEKSSSEEANSFDRRFVASEGSVSQKDDPDNIDIWEANIEVIKFVVQFLFSDVFERKERKRRMARNEPDPRDRSRSRDRFVFHFSNECRSQFVFTMFEQSPQPKSRKKHAASQTVI